MYLCWNRPNILPKAPDVLSYVGTEAADLFHGQWPTLGGHVGHALRERNLEGYEETLEGTKTNRLPNIYARQTFTSLKSLCSKSYGSSARKRSSLYLGHIYDDWVAKS